MFCVKCGNQFSGNFCDKCGAPKQDSPVAVAPVVPTETTITFNSATFFDNIGSKIKTVSKFMCVAILIIFLTLGIYTLIESRGYAAAVINGILYIGFAPILALANLFIGYGIGVLVENSNKMREIAEKNAEE